MKEIFIKGVDLKEMEIYFTVNDSSRIKTVVITDEVFIYLKKQLWDLVDGLRGEVFPEWKLNYWDKRIFVQRIERSLLRDSTSIKVLALDTETKEYKEKDFIIDNKGVFQTRWLVLERELIGIVGKALKKNKEGENDK